MKPTASTDSLEVPAGARLRAVKSATDAAEAPDSSTATSPAGCAGCKALKTERRELRRQLALACMNYLRLHLAREREVARLTAAIRRESHHIDKRTDRDARDYVLGAKGK